MTKYVEWNEPLWSLEDGHDILGNSIVRALPEDIIKWQRTRIELKELSDERILDHFMVINWAWFKEYEE